MESSFVNPKNKENGQTYVPIWKSQSIRPSHARRIKQRSLRQQCFTTHAHMSALANSIARLAKKQQPKVQAAPAAPAPAPPAAAAVTGPKAPPPPVVEEIEVLDQGAAAPKVAPLTAAAINALNGNHSKPSQGKAAAKKTPATEAEEEDAPEAHGDDDEDDGQSVATDATEMFENARRDLFGDGEDDDKDEEGAPVEQVETPPPPPSKKDSKRRKAAPKKAAAKKAPAAPKTKKPSARSKKRKSEEEPAAAAADDASVAPVAAAAAEASPAPPPASEVTTAAAEPVAEAPPVKKPAAKRSRSSSSKKKKATATDENNTNTTSDEPAASAAPAAPPKRVRKQTSPAKISTEHKTWAETLFHQFQAPSDAKYVELGSLVQSSAARDDIHMYATEIAQQFARETAEANNALADALGEPRNPHSIDAKVAIDDSALDALVSAAEQVCARFSERLDLQPGERPAGSVMTTRVTGPAPPTFAGVFILHKEFTEGGLTPRWFTFEEAISHRTITRFESVRAKLAKMVLNGYKRNGVEFHVGEYDTVMDQPELDDGSAAKPLSEKDMKKLIQVAAGKDIDEKISAQLEVSKYHAGDQIVLADDSADGDDPEQAPIGAEDPRLVDVYKNAEFGGSIDTEKLEDASWDRVARRRAFWNIDELYAWQAEQFANEAHLVAGAKTKTRTSRPKKAAVPATDEAPAVPADEAETQDPADAVTQDPNAEADAPEEPAQPAASMASQVLEPPAPTPAPAPTTTASPATKLLSKKQQSRKAAVAAQ